METLVALLVLSVGLLGIAALQVQGMGAGRTAHYRGHAANLAADMAERIRSNPLGLDAYAGSGSDHRCAPAAGEGPGAGLDCTPEQMAAHDLFLWDRTIRATLPAGDWDIHVDSGSAPPGYRLKISWVEPRHGELTYELSLTALRR